ncbi:MAG: isoprenylcysteine carboxylmethyltransferase family protein [Anaerolineales bacterium]|jgi:protein-S-isoprenylcysteine O-methyltransferase Ste14
MPQNSLFGPVVVLLAVMLYGGLHSLTASPAIKSLAARLMGENYDRLYRLLFNIAGGITFLPVLYLVARYPGQTLYSMGMPWLALSLAGQVLAVVILLVGVYQTDAWHFLGLSQLVGNKTTSSNGLVISGLYRYVRHPLYTAGLLFIWLTPVMTTSVMAMNLALTVYIYIGSSFEEQRLVAEYGQSYQQYQKQVPRLIPNPLQIFR